MARKPLSAIADPPAEAAPPEPAPAEAQPAGDIRKVRPYILSPRPLRAIGRRVASVMALVALDLAGLTLGLYIAFALRWIYYERSLPLWGVPWKGVVNWLPFLALITVLVFTHNGLYAAREFRSGAGRIVSSLGLVALLSLAFGLGIGHDFNTFTMAPTALVLTALLITLLRASYDVITKDVFRFAGVRRRVVLVGEGGNVSELHRALGFGRNGIDYEFVGVVSRRADGVPLPDLGRVSDLSAILDRERVDELIVADSDYEQDVLLEIAEEAHRRGLKVRIAPTTTEILVQRAEYIPGQGVPLFELRPPAFEGADWAVKRAFDLVVSIGVVVLGLPLWLAIAAAIKLTSPGPVLYRDRRVGLNEREFGMLKFRTMYADAAERQAQLEPANEASGPLFKIRRDPRVTPVGRFLRRFSLDEVPQVLNVLRGEMSLVGPRPLPLRDFRQLADWHRKRYLVLPGMTGLWQVSGRSNLSFDDLVRLDFYYLENWSIWLDISILARTIPAVVARRGAY
ncbi:MAG: sugar transferase [Actinomycetota bacterium]|nr:sugar transferase [Actinomycetota bacterium]